MKNVCLSELRKLFRFKFVALSLLITLGLELLFTYLLYWKAKGFLVLDLEKSSGLSYSFRSIAPFIGIISLCIYASNTAQEYLYGTLKNLLIRMPNRTQLILGKVLALSIFVSLLITLAAIWGATLSYIFSPLAKVSTGKWFLFSTSFITTWANVVLSSIAYGLIGSVIALILRSSVGAISAGIIWILVVETLFGFLGKAIARWLPGANLANFGDGGSKELSYTHSLLVVLIYVGIGLIIMVTLFSKRDVAN